MGKEKTLIAGILVADIILLSIVVVGYYFLAKAIDSSLVVNISSIQSLLATCVISFLASYSIYPSIIQKRMVKSEDIAKRVIATCMLMFLFVCLTTLLIRPYTSFPRTFLISLVLIYMVCLFTERFFLRKFFMFVRSKNKNQKRIILIGNEPTVCELYKVFSTPAYGYEIVGTFFDGECECDEVASCRIGGMSDIYGWLATHNNINEIYGYFPKEQQDIINMVSKFCDNHLIRFYYIPAIDIFKGNMAFSFIENIPVIARREEPLSNPLNKFIKRVFDIVFSGLVLIFIFPWVWIFVAIMIKIKSPGPIFFLQERTGIDGKIFKCMKFRSMKVNDQADTLQATKDDPRKFPFGDFMRKTNIDELPQFINVFKGDMSIVGPRPHMLKHTEEYSKLINRFMVRHLAKPGITGLAQVTGFRGETRYIDQMEGRVKKDIEYIENWTFLLDIKIIIKTVTNVIFRQEKGNAY